MSPLPTGTRFPIQVISTIKPVNGASFPVVSDTDIEGGYQVRATISERNSIPAENRKIGMLVYVQANDTVYTLTGGITDGNWTIKEFDCGTLDGDVVGAIGENLINSVHSIPLDTSTAPTQGSTLQYIQTLDSTIFQKPQSITTDGTYVWVGNYQNKTVTKTTLSTRTSVNIDLSSVLPGGSKSFPKSLKLHASYPNYVFMGGNESTRVIILDRTTNAVVGLGSTGTSTVSCIAIDNFGNVWAGSYSNIFKVYKFNIANMIASYPTVVSPDLSIDSAVIVNYEDIAIDGNFLWGTSNNGDLGKIDIVNNTDLGTYSGYPDGWYYDIIIDSGFVYVVDQQLTRLLKFDPSTWLSGPVSTTGTLTNIAYLTSFCLKNGSFWVPDNSSLEGPSDDNIVQVDQTTFLQTGTFARPDTESQWYGIVGDPVLPRIYVAVFDDSSSQNNFGFRVFDTNTLTWIDSFTKYNNPQLKYVKVTCTSAARPATPYVGQMVFVTDLITPGPIPLWWDGTNWIDALGTIR